jgi:hypothetical protein
MVVLAVVMPNSFCARVGCLERMLLSLELPGKFALRDNRLFPFSSLASGKKFHSSLLSLMFESPLVSPPSHSSSWTFLLLPAFTYP